MAHALPTLVAQSSEITTNRHLDLRVTASPRFVASDLLHLQEIQFDRGRAAEDRHHHLQRVLVEVHLVDDAVEAGERTLVDPHVIALLERVLRLRLLRRGLHLLENVVHFLFAERRRLGAGADEPGDLRRVLDDVPRVVGHRHLDEDVTGEEPARALHFAAAALLHDVLGRNEDVADLLLQPVRLHALLQRLLHLVLEPRVGVDDVPVLLLGGDVAHATPDTRKIHRTIRSSARSSPQRYTPKNIAVSTTTSVVA